MDTIESDNTEFICNVKRSKRDNRDFIYIGRKTGSNSSLLSRLDYRNELLPIRNQGKQGSCYAQSAACMKEWQEKREYGLNEYFSPQFFYNNRFNKYDDKTNNDYGMYGRNVMKLLKTTGICSEKIYPYGKIEHKDKISAKVYLEAKNHTIKWYARIKTIDNLKKALINNGPCLITFPVYHHGSFFWQKKRGQKSKGGHAVVVVGYNEIGFILRNSWGKKWGNDGYTIYNYDNWNSHWELWTTIDDKTDVIIEPSKLGCCICQ